MTIKLNHDIDLEDIVIPIGIYEYEDRGPGAGWPMLKYKDEWYDFIPDGTEEIRR